MSPFRVLFREFFGQFFASESVTSDVRLRQAIIAVIAFLITPGLLFSVQLFPVYELARFRAPELILPMTRLVASLFLTFSTVSIGLIAALVWDALSFDRRDAMVLGPLPVGRGTVIRAKLCALAALLLGASLSIGILTAVPFAMVANGRAAPAGRHLVAHIVATSYASLFVFSVIVMLRALLGMMARGHMASALASLLQFAFVSGLLCFFILAPTALDVAPRGRGIGLTVRMADLPGWMPTRYFLAMYEQLRGTADPDMVAIGQRTALATLAVVAAAVLTTIAGYRRQLQLALAPPATTSGVGTARVSRALARAMLGSDRVALATADFVLVTLARNRTQQAPIAMTTALGVALIIVHLIGRGGVIAAIGAPPAALGTGLILVFWACIGMRASFFVPSELPASWSFRANASDRTPAYALATRAAIVAFIAPAALVAALVGAGPLRDWTASLQHVVFVLLAVAALADFIALTVDHIPFTRAYLPGHARLKTRWPLYLLGSYGFGWGLSSLELYVTFEPHAFAGLLAIAAIVVAVLDWAVRRAGQDWTTQPDEDLEEDSFSVTTLDLASPAPRQA